VKNYAKGRLMMKYKKRNILKKMKKKDQAKDMELLKGINRVVISEINRW
jgi:hypothetical protein